MLQTTYLHSGWEFAEASWEKGGDYQLSSPGWLTAEVPGHVHLDLVRHGIIADPFSMMNELGCQWVDQKDWSYRTSFEWQPAEGLPNRVLRFEGLDTVCTVFLNDQEVAKHDNMFLPLEIDVTDKLVAGTNTIRIDFESASRVGYERQAKYFKEQGLEEPQQFPERSFVRKAQYMSGWDWGPRLVSCGIWQPVKLIEYDLRLLGIDVTAEVKTEGGAYLDVMGTINGEQRFQSRLIAPDGEVFEPSDALPFKNVYQLEDPLLWHPDEPNLYTLEVWIEGQGHRTQQVGFKTCRLLQEADQYGESFEFEINGEKLWARGANWIPDHSFPSTITRAQLRDRLEKCKDMGFNMLRVWGGGLYETEDFYELCDELGILVWQDFPFACAYYPDTDEWQQVVRQEATINVERIRQHVSLCLWCGNNENEEMSYSKWGDAAKHPPRYYGENFYNEVLPQVLRDTDPRTPYIRTSPIGNAPVDDPVAAKQRGPNSGGYGDQHCWDVWHGRGDWKYYADSTGRFSSEYGFASSCSLATWDNVLDTWAEDYPFDVNDPILRWHDKTRKGYENFVNYVKLHYPEPEMLADWVYYSQLNQRDALKAGVEHYRRSPFCRGSLIWQLNDCWPVQSWAILDCDGHYKALAYELRRLYADLMLSIERHDDRVQVHVVNDGREGTQGHLSLYAYHLTSGEAKLLGEQNFTLNANDRKTFLEASVKGLSAPDTILVASAETDADEATAWTLLAEPKQTRFPAPEPIVASLAEEGYLTLQIPTAVVDLMLTDEDDVANFHDNFPTTVRPTKLQVRYWGNGEGLEARSLAGYHPIKLTRSPI